MKQFPPTNKWIEDKQHVGLDRECGGEFVDPNISLADQMQNPCCTTLTSSSILVPFSRNLAYVFPHACDIILHRFRKAKLPRFFFLTCKVLRGISHVHFICTCYQQIFYCNKFSFVWFTLVTFIYCNMHDLFVCVCAHIKPSVLSAYHLTAKIVLQVRSSKLLFHNIGFVSSIFSNMSVCSIWD